MVERTDEPAAADNPLTRELKAALADRAARGASIPIVVSASAGLGSRDVSAGDLVAVFDWLDRPDLADGPRWASLGVRHPSALEPAADQPAAGRARTASAATRSAGSAA